MNRTTRTTWVAVVVFSWLGVTSAAHADILFIDTNDQAGERKAALDLAHEFGERLHIVKGAGPGLEPEEAFRRELEEVFRSAEAGTIDLSTVVLSGASDGATFYGRNGEVRLQQILFRYPKARLQVRHFIALGDYTGELYNHTAWQQRLPNATLIAGFNGSSPYGQPSARFLREVYSSIAKARRAAGGSDAFSRSLGDASEIVQLKQILSALDSVRNTSATFTVCGDFYNPKGSTPESIKLDYERGWNRFHGYLAADTHYPGVPPAPDGPSQLRTFHDSAQAYLRIVPESKRAEVYLEKEQAIRLIYFENVKRSWSRYHEAERAAANRALAPTGVLIPDATALATMTRRQILERINALQRVSGSLTGPDARGAQALILSMHTELRNLHVPFSWIDGA